MGTGGLGGNTRGLEPGRGCRGTGKRKTYPVCADFVEGIGRRVDLGSLAGSWGGGGVQGREGVLELHPPLERDLSRADVGRVEKADFLPATGLDVGDGDADRLEAIARGVRRAHVRVDHGLGLRAFHARGESDTTLVQGAVLEAPGRVVVQHVAEGHVLDGQVLDIAVEAALDPGVAAPPNLLERE